jgi:hypothetical protein
MSQPKRAQRESAAGECVDCHYGLGAVGSPAQVVGRADGGGQRDSVFVGHLAGRGPEAVHHQAGPAAAPVGHGHLGWRVR